MLHNQQHDFFYKIVPYAR